MKKTVVLIVLIFLVIGMIDGICTRILFPTMSAGFGVRQLEDSDEVWQEMQGFEWGKTKHRVLLYGAGVFLSYVIVMTTEKKKRKVKDE